MNVQRLLAAFACIAPFSAAFADVTEQEQITLNVAIIKAHASTITKIAGDKKRSESDFRCDGFMSMLCGKNQSLQIVRLDRDVTWSADPKKKQYTEQPFPTPEQRRAAEERMRAAMEKLKSCPVPASTPASQSIDTSQCEMSPPKFSVNKTEDVATIVGHSTHRTMLNMTQSCAVKQSADVCDMSYTFDLWLTDDEIPELADRRSFDRNYMRKLGLADDERGATPDEFKKFLAPYANAMKELGSKTSDLKGYPLKTTLRVAFGGPHCSKAAGTSPASGGESSTLPSAGTAAASAAGSATENAAASTASGAIGHATGGNVGGGIAASAAGAFTSKLVGGLFAKKPKPDPAPAASTSATATAPDNGLIQVAEFTVETKALSSGSIPAEQFEIPPDWKKVMPKQDDAMREASCPTTTGT